MKIIDLLNKIANEEEVPEKIKIGNKVYNYETFNIEKGDDYFTAKWEKVKGYRASYDGTYYYLEIRDYDLNDEVEIIEEEKKIPEKLSTWFSVETKQSKELNIEYANTNFENMYEKINEIIDYLDYFKSKGE